MIPNPVHATQIHVINVVSSPVFTLSIISRIGFDETGSFLPGVFSGVSPGLFGDMLPSYRTMKYKSPIWGYFHVQKE